MSEVKGSLFASLQARTGATLSQEIRLLHELLPSLCDEEVLVIYFRYWERLLIDDIAKILGRSWSDVDQLIENSIAKLRQGFMACKQLEGPKAA